MIARAIDGLISLFSPRAGLERIALRASLDQINKLMGTAGGYDAARLSRLTAFKPTLNENAIDASSLDRLEGSARDLWRNNPHARKIVRQIQVRTLGKGMRPISLAMNGDGKPDFAFRKQANVVWHRWCSQSDSRGRPGRGGQHYGEQSKTGLASVIRSGNVLYRLRTLTAAEQRRRGLYLPIVLQLIDAARLDHSISEFGGRKVFRGIELNADGSVAAYHVLPAHPSDPIADYDSNSTRLPASEIGHVFVTDDIDQVFGVSWFAPALNPMRDTGDYTYAELKAAAMGACVVAGIKMPTGSGAPGLAAPSCSSLTDNDGNPITRLQPGMFFNLGTDGKIEGFNPQRPNTNAAEFIHYLLRSVATGFPGVKGSSVTGDYRGSSFASERSADNELWPEVEGLQSWWGCSFNQPIYEQVITTAVLQGEFDDVLNTNDFLQRRQSYLAADWQGPVQKSINPVDDEKASESALRNGTSSVQIEGAKKGRSALDILQDVEEYVEQVDELEIDDELKRLLKLQAIGAAPQAGGTPPGESADGAGKPDDEHGTDDTDDDEADDNVTAGDRAARRFSLV